MPKFNVKIYISSFFLGFIFTLFTSSVLGQTAGSMQAQTIISLVKEYLQKQTEISTLEEKVRKEKVAMNEKINERFNDIEEIKNEWLEVLSDLQNGYYCSLCGKSRKQFGGEVPFRNHLSDVNAKRVPASPEQIAKERKRYEALIEKAQEEYDNLVQSGGKYKINIQDWDQQIQKLRSRLEDIKNQIYIYSNKWNALVYENLIKDFTNLHVPILQEIWKLRRTEIGIKKMEEVIDKMDREKDSVIRVRIGEYRERNEQEKVKKEAELRQVHAAVDELGKQHKLYLNTHEASENRIHQELSSNWDKINRESNPAKAETIWNRILYLQKDSFNLREEFARKKQEYESELSKLKLKIADLDKILREIFSRIHNESDISNAVRRIYDRKVNLLKEVVGDLKSSIYILNENIRTVEKDAFLKRNIILNRHDPEIMEIRMWLNKIGMSFYASGYSDAVSKYSHFTTCCAPIKENRTTIYDCPEIESEWLKLGPPDGLVKTVNTQSPVSQTNLDILLQQIKK